MKFRVINEDGSTFWYSPQFCAELIKREGALGLGKALDETTGLRCAVGVLVDVHSPEWEEMPPDEAFPRWKWVDDYNNEINTGRLAGWNDSFPGTPQERASFIAHLLEHRSAWL